MSAKACRVIAPLGGVVYQCKPRYYVVIGAPITKKNHPQMFRNKKTGASFPMPSKPLVEWTKLAVNQLGKEHDGRAPIAHPVNVSAIFWRLRDIGDLNNFTAALADALQKAGVVSDDKWIMGWDGSRLAKDADRPRIELVISDLISLENSNKGNP